MQLLVYGVPSEALISEEEVCPSLFYMQSEKPLLLRLPTRSWTPLLAGPDIQNISLCSTGSGLSVFSRYYRECSTTTVILVLWFVLWFVRLE